jgi:NADH-quinone oxidoreductase subunit L
VLDIKLLSILIVLAPLAGSLISGLGGKKIGIVAAHCVTILGVAISFILSCVVFYQISLANMEPFNGPIYIWGTSGALTFSVGFLIDKLSAMVMLVVTFVSLMVHIYSVGYMQGDPGNQRFFSYMSLFTFMMLMLVMSNNFLQLYFGWEGVGLVSYLLIGFWFKRDAANAGSLKAFLVNRVGDFGFLLGIAAIAGYFKTLDYASVFAHVPDFANTTVQLLSNTNWSVLTVICILLFIGAMGKSAQMPLHIWLPESMEGPTPISALIHAATMVTAGIFMIARMSPIFEYSQTALSLVLIVGATGALFTGILAIVQQDIKRVIAYSTLSQLGYMVAALGVSAFSAGIFHLVTHAFFKALLFLAAGSVIIAMHHEQDMRKMGGLWRYMPITYVTFLIGALALSAVPPFSGFYSKDMIIEAIKLATIPGANYAYICVLLGAYVTAFYIFRAFFLTFHTEERFAREFKKEIHESSTVVVIPLILLAIPSVIIGAMLIQPMLFPAVALKGLDNGLLGNSIMVFSQYNVLAQLAHEFQGATVMALHAVISLPFWFALAGILTAYGVYIYSPDIPNELERRFSWLHKILQRKYGFDDFNQVVLVHGTQKLAKQFYKVSDQKLIDDGLINGSGRLINWLSAAARRLQTGYIYHYAFVMIIGLLIFMFWLLR